MLFTNHRMEEPVRRGGGLGVIRKIPVSRGLSGLGETDRERMRRIAAEQGGIPNEPEYYTKPSRERLAESSFFDNYYRPAIPPVPPAPLRGAPDDMNTGILLLVALGVGAAAFMVGKKERKRK
jgi:hypothetical protein